MTKKELLRQLLQYRYAHRGFHQKPIVPENSMIAFRRAVSEGFGIELDLHLTADGKLAVIHDNSLKRTCGVDLIIEQLTLTDAQMYFLEKSQERIPEFCDVLREVDGNTPLIIELKAGKDAEGRDNTESLCIATMEALKGYTGMYCIESFSPLIVKWMRKNRPDVIRGQLAAHLNKNKKTLPWMQDFLLKHLLVNLSGRPDFVAYQFADRQEPAFVRFKGAKFFWTIREYRDLKKAEEMGAAAIFETFNPKDYEGKRG